MTTETNPIPCGNAAHMGEHACTDRSQCWEPCGELGKSAEHATVAPADAVPEPIVIDEFHLHELIDRAWVLCEMFDTTITGHPAARLLKDEIAAVAERLSNLYQLFGALRYSRQTGSIQALPVFDAADYLQSEADIAAYIAEFSNDIGQATTAEELRAALETVDRARAKNKLRQSGTDG